jgi:IclR family transcriptional regulator, acetate operon repressor
VISRSGGDDGSAGAPLVPRTLSGGCVLLCERYDPAEEITALYAAPDSPVTDVSVLLRELRRIRRQGFAVNDQRTETGVTAVGRALRNADGTTTAGISIAMPTLRYHNSRLPGWAQHLATTTARIERDLAANAAAAP